MNEILSLPLNLTANVAQAIIQVLKALTNAAYQLMINLPNIAQHFVFNVVPEILKSSYNLTKSMVVNTVNLLPDIVKAVSKTVPLLIDKARNKLPLIAIQLYYDIPWYVGSFIAKLPENIARTIDQIAYSIGWGIAMSPYALNSAFIKVVETAKYVIQNIPKVINNIVNTAEIILTVVVPNLLRSLGETVKGIIKYFANKPTSMKDILIAVPLITTIAGVVSYKTGLTKPYIDKFISLLQRKLDIVKDMVYDFLGLKMQKFNNLEQKQYVAELKNSKGEDNKPSYISDKANDNISENSKENPNTRPVLRIRKREASASFSGALTPLYQLGLMATRNKSMPDLLLHSINQDGLNAMGVNNSQLEDSQVLKSNRITQ